MAGDYYYYYLFFFHFAGQSFRSGKEILRQNKFFMSTKTQLKSTLVGENCDELPQSAFHKVSTFLSPSLVSTLHVFKIKQTGFRTKVLV